METQQRNYLLWPYLPIKSYLTLIKITESTAATGYT